MATPFPKTRCHRKSHSMKNSPTSPAYEPFPYSLLSVLGAIGASSLFDLFYLRKNWFADPTWVENALEQFAPCLFMIALLIGLKLAKPGPGLFKTLLLKKPQTPKSREYLVGFALIIALVVPILVALPHWIPAAKSFYPSNPILDDECVNFLRKALRAGHGDWMVYFLLPKFVAVCLLGPFLEEIFFRGLLFQRLIPACGVVKAGVFSVIVFMLAHMVSFEPNWLETAPFILLAAGLIGGMGCQLLHETRCLWVPILFHVLCNTLVFAMAFGRVLM